MQSTSIPNIISFSQFLEPTYILLFNEGLLYLCNFLSKFGIKSINLTLGVKLYKKNKFTNYQSFKLMLIINLVANLFLKSLQKEQTKY